MTRKAVVVEAGKGWAVILLPGGEYKKIKTKQYLEAGELYQLKSGTGAKYLAAAAIFLIILLGSIDYYTVQAYAENSTLELGVNRWGRVISVQAKNDEGQRIINAVKIKNEPLETAVAKISRAVKEEKPGRQDMISRPSLDVKVKDKAKQELKRKMLEKIDKGLQRDIPAKNKNDKKEIKTESKPQNSNPDDLNKKNKQESSKDPQAKQDNSRGKLEKPENDNKDIVDRTRGMEVVEDLPVIKKEPANQITGNEQAGKKDDSIKDNGNKREKQRD